MKNLFKKAKSFFKKAKALLSGLISQELKKELKDELNAKGIFEIVGGACLLLIVALLSFILLCMLSA